MKSITRRLHKIRTHLAMGLLNKTARINRNPIIVLGNQKSGTTAIAALLAEYGDISATLDMKNIHRVYAGDLSFDKYVQRNRYHFSRHILKEPCFTFLYRELERVFPAATFLMIVRDPRDNIRSLLNRLDINGDLEDIDSNTFFSLGPWRFTFDSTKLGIQGGTYIDVLAHRWNYAVDVYLDRSREMILVRYEDFVADKIGTIEELARRLAMTHINDISGKVDIQYQPRGKDRGTPWEEFFGQENLMRIERICGDRMREFGYASSTSEDRLDNKDNDG